MNNGGEKGLTFSQKVQLASIESTKLTLHQSQREVALISLKFAGDSIKESIKLQLENAKLICPIFDPNHHEWIEYLELSKKFKSHQKKIEEFSIASTNAKRDGHHIDMLLGETSKKKGRMTINPSSSNDTADSTLTEE